jgi:periplasmic divalent cation tolerance protein
MSMTSARLILTTTGSRQEAQALASALVGARAAACVNIVGPIESHYWWNDKADTASEYLLLIKTTVSEVERVREKIRELHSYEVPEFIVLDIERGDTKYLEWIAGAVRSD